MAISDQIEKLLLRGFIEETDHQIYLSEKRKSADLSVNLNLKELNNEKHFKANSFENIFQLVPGNHRLEGCIFCNPYHALV